MSVSEEQKNQWDTKFRQETVESLKPDREGSPEYGNNAGKGITQTTAEIPALPLWGVWP